MSLRSHRRRRYTSTLATSRHGGRGLEEGGGGLVQVGRPVHQQACPLCAQARDRRIRRFDVLFTVYQLAQRWRALQRRREARLAAYERALDVAAGEERDAIQRCVDLLREASSMQARPLALAAVRGSVRGLRQVLACIT